MKRYILFLLLSLFAFIPGAWAQSIWNVVNGDWHTPGNWSPSGVPTAAMDVRIGTNTTERTVNITSADAFSSAAYIGYDSGQIGTVEVGTARTWTADGIVVGNNGIGSLTIEAGGKVTNFIGYIGFDSGSDGTVTVTGVNSLWQNSGALYVAYSGTGTLNIENGGKVTSGSGFIGYNSTGDGTVMVTGANSLWQNSGFLRVGSQGTGSLNIEDGGKVTNTSSIIGLGSIGDGTVTVTGANSLWQNSGALSVGYNGIGKLTIEDGGKVTATDVTLAYSGANSQGALNLNGTSSSRGVLETAYLIEGSGALGSKINFDGGILRATQNETNFLRDFETGDVQILSGGAFFDTDRFNVSVTSTLQFQGIGGLTKQGVGTLTLSGERNYTGDNFVVQGTLANAVSYIAQHSGETGSMTVTGSSSLWENSSILYVGHNGTGKLNIEDGGKVSNTSGLIGFNSTSDGSVTVTGANSLWQISGTLSVGNAGTGKLAIEDGGKVTNATGNIGNGDVMVTGADSLWTSSANLLVGSSSTGKLTIEDGGKVTNVSGYIGSNSSGDGTVKVTGANSLWQSAGDLYVGYNGTGKLTIEGSGKVTASAVTLANGGANGQGTLNLNGTFGSRGVLETAIVYEGSGVLGSKLNFDGGILRATGHQTNFLRNFEIGDIEIKAGGAFIDSKEFNIGISTILQGVGGLTKQGTGKLTLATASTYGGGTVVEAGTLSLSAGASLAESSGFHLAGNAVLESADAFTLGTAQTLSGTGTFQGDLSVEGTLSPGDSPGELHHTGTQTWQGGGTYLWDVNARPGDGQAGTNWDLISITGDLVFAATESNPFHINLVSLTGANEAGLLDGFNAAEDYLWRILTVSGSIMDFNPLWASVDTSRFENDLLGGTFSVSQSGQSLYVNFTAGVVPEPGRAVLLVVGLAAVLTQRRRVRISMMSES